MREMKNRLLAIEAELQTLYRETGDESEVSRAGRLPYGNVGNARWNIKFLKETNLGVVCAIFDP